MCAKIATAGRVLIFTWSAGAGACRRSQSQQRQRDV